MKIFTKTFLTIFANLILFQINAQVLGSLNFNGDDNYIEVENSPLNEIDTGDFTIEAWIKGEESEQTAHPMILSNRGTSSSGGGVFVSFHALWGGSQSKMLNFQIDNVNYIFIDNGSFNGSILDNECHHIAVSRKGNILFFYVDGNEIGNKVIPNSLTVNFDGPLWIGKDKATNNTFNGTISQCRIWNIARTESEINESKDASLLGNETGLLAYWEMDNEEGQIVSDKTGLFNGTLGSSDQMESQDPVWSEEGCIEEAIVSVNDNLVPSFKITPNPTYAFLTIEHQSTEDVQIELVDQIGKILLSKRVNTQTTNLDISNYPQGIYYLSISYNDKVYTEKIIKL